VFPTVDRFLLFALLNGMILGHDAGRRHPRPNDRAALAGVISRLLPTRRLGCGSRCSMSVTATASSPVAALPPGWRSGARLTTSSWAVGEVVTSF
jgi:hypothetical protein